MKTIKLPDLASPGCSLPGWTCTMFYKPSWWHPLARARWHARIAKDRWHAWRLAKRMGLILPLLLLLAGCVTSETTMDGYAYGDHMEAVGEWTPEQNAAWKASIPKGTKVTIKTTSPDWDGFLATATGLLFVLGYGAHRMQQRTEERTVARVNAERGPAKPMELTPEQAANLERMAKEAT